jgi:hypothetical protein
MRNLIILILLIFVVIKCSIAAEKYGPEPVVSDERDPFHEAYSMIDVLSEEVVR